MIQSICNSFKSMGSLADATEVYMIFLETNCYSHSLMRRVEFNVLLPERKKSGNAVGISDGKYKTIWLLHGLSGDQNSWIRRTSIERYAEKYGFAVVMPNVDRSWYTDTAYGAKYFTFITKELPEICRGCFKGMSADDALAEMRRRFATHGRSAWMSAPETEAQVNFIREFANTYQQLE